MISYELVKKLKDAGFPQKGSGQDFVVIGETGDGFPTGKHYIPTLSELIEAVRKIGGYPKFLLEHDREMGWQASLFSLQDCPHAEGSTPEEAVANLWLALNT